MRLNLTSFLMLVIGAKVTADVSANINCELPTGTYQKTCPHINLYACTRELNSPDFVADDHICMIVAECQPCNPALKLHTNQLLFREHSQYNLINVDGELRNQISKRSMSDNQQLLSAYTNCHAVENSKRANEGSNASKIMSDYNQGYLWGHYLLMQLRA